VPDTFSLRVNGVRHDVSCEPDTPLLYVLRDDLGLTAAKFGCGLGLCGSCNVLVDGQAVHSCDTPVWSVADREVTTLEGLGDETNPHPVQRAFVEHQALQCGYCTAGMIMSSLGLLESKREPTNDEILKHMDGNVCRCGTYPRILAAIRRGQKAMQEADHE
jgi:nicotinate dehydrogenase subunit A